MKVLIISGSYPPAKCGVGDYTYHLANALAKIPSVQVGVLTGTDGKNHNDDDKALVFPTMGNWRLGGIAGVIKILRHWKPDIVHIQYPTQGYGRAILPWLLPSIAFFARTKVVQTWHEGFGLWRAPMLLLKVLIPGGLVVVRPNYWEALHPWLFWIRFNKTSTFIQSASTIPKASLTEEERAIEKLTYAKTGKQLIVFFGFIYPHKGVDQLFDILNPDVDHLVIAGAIIEEDDYCQLIQCRVEEGNWKGAADIVGFLAPEKVAVLLAAADAVILPFKLGGGEWNTSIHAATLNETFVITTSLSQHGYDADKNIYYAKPNDIADMKSALRMYSGRCAAPRSGELDPWARAADEHKTLYEKLFK